jgi:hypothetical protein
MCRPTSSGQLPQHPSRRMAPRSKVFNQDPPQRRDHSSQDRHQLDGTRRGGGSLAMSACYARSDSSRAGWRHIHRQVYPSRHVSRLPPDAPPNRGRRRALTRHRETRQDRPLIKFCQVRGRSVWWWRVEDSNLRSFRDGLQIAVLTDADIGAATITAATTA